jgi:hypothetical protein
MTLSMIAAFLVEGSWTTCVAVHVASSKKLLTFDRVTSPLSVP